MEPKFKNGTAVKLKDDVVYGEDYNGITLREGRWAIKGEKYTVSEPEDRGLGYSYLLDQTGFYVGEDALELWSEPVSHPVDGARKEANERIQQAKNIEFKPKTDGILEQLNTVGKQEVKSEIDPQPKKDISHITVLAQARLKLTEQICDMSLNDGNDRNGNWAKLRELKEQAEQIDRLILKLSEL